MTLLLVALTSGCGGAPEAPPAVGDPLPAFAAVSLEGDSVDLQGLRGSPVLLNLWATWCAPCRREMPYLERVHQRYGPRGLRTVGISVDTRNARDDVDTFLEEAGVTYTVLLDPAMRAMDVFQLLGLPATYLVDAGGRIRFARTGPVEEGDAPFEEALEALVEEGR